jgi:predicted RNA binding protein YcfA (HicA-like mRNA interferase family)
MPRPKTLSGPEVIRILGLFGFVVASQRGSHVKLRRVLNDGTRQTLTVPNHRELDRGTAGAIYRQALRYISGEELAPHFFTN